MIFPLRERNFTSAQFSEKHRPIKDEAPTSQDARAKGEREKTTAIYDASKVLDGAPIKKDQ